MQHPHPSGPHTASLELTPVGGRLSIVALVASTPASSKVAEVGVLAEELDKLGLGRAHTGTSIAPAAPLKSSCVAQEGKGNYEGGTENEKEAAAAASGEGWSFRVQQQQLLDGQHALRFSLWRPRQKPDPSDPSTFSNSNSISQGGPAGRPLSDGEGKGLSEGGKGAYETQLPSVCNFYFRLPCSLPSLTLLSSSYALKQAESAAGAATSQQQKDMSLCEIRLSLKCSLRPGSISEALQEGEERSMRSLSAFRLTCKRCGECVAQLRDAGVFLLPSPIWTEAHYVTACEECASASLVACDFSPKPGRVCAGQERLFLSRCDTQHLLTGPWVACSDASFVCQAPISCASCGTVLGSEKQRKEASEPLQLRTAGSASSPGFKGATSGHACDCSDKHAKASSEGLHAAEISRTDLPPVGGSVGPQEQRRFPPLSEDPAGSIKREVWREVSLLKRRISLHPFVSGTWGPNLLIRHSDLAAFTEELCSYSRAAAALRFLVLPFVPPRGVESPWEIGRQAPLSCKAEQKESSSASDPEEALRAPAHAWGAVSRGTTALELRVLLRECFMAVSGTRDAGSQGYLAMKVLLHEVTGTDGAGPKPQETQGPRGGCLRLHFVRVDLKLFGELMRLMRMALVGGRDGDSVAPQQHPLLGVSKFSDGSAVVFLPLL